MPKSPTQEFLLRSTVKPGWWGRRVVTNHAVINEAKPILSWTVAASAEHNMNPEDTY
ncbi:hypothetical protein EYZ11_012409 [Aspergillus tanneri]|uniref:Uncharacterized protein n=1 Tax=Aspergillus tanneri TaxID=1220188 RepID=A0A4S3J0K8_9EURO|nr:hypothetical protein EYZ11_012409 [Aspergillus tanneri]